MVGDNGLFHFLTNPYYLYFYSISVSFRTCFDHFSCFLIRWWWCLCCALPEVPELRYACTCGACIATPEGYVEARHDALVFRSLTCHESGQSVVCPGCGLVAIGLVNI